MKGYLSLKDFISYTITPTPIILPMPDPNICVLIDFENIAAGTEKAQLGKFNIDAVMNRLKERGRILIARAYGDWGRYAKFKQDLLRAGVAMMELTSYRGQDKNRADIALVVDAMELAFSRDHIDTYVLLSGDSDFTPLVMKLREFNKHVIGVGTRPSTSRLLSASCDEFIFYENIRRGANKPVEVSGEESGEETVTITKVEAFEKLVEAVQGLQRDLAGPVSSGVLKQAVLRKIPTFDEAEYGYTGFAKFLEGAKKKGLITLNADTRAGGYFVSLIGDSTSSSDTAEESKSTLPQLSPEADRLREVLTSKKNNPTTHFMRHVLVHELVDHVQERALKKKRNTLLYLFGDINRRCRKTDPVVPPEFVRAIINSLHSAGCLLHPDGNPVRNQKANFVIQQEPEELLTKLRDHYLRTLLEAGENLENSGALSELLWGDEEHTLEIEQALSWVQLELSKDVESTSKDDKPKGKEDPPEKNIQTDDIKEDTKPSVKAKEAAEPASKTDSPAETPDTAAPQVQVKKPVTRRRSRRKPSTTETSSETKTADESPKAPPKRKRIVKRKKVKPPEDSSVAQESKQETEASPRTPKIETVTNLSPSPQSDSKE